MAEQPKASGGQIVLQRTGWIEEVDSGDRAVDDVGAERDELEMIVMKLKLEEADQE
jgi:hypothetical protein